MKITYSVTKFIPLKNIRLFFWHVLGEWWDRSCSDLEFSVCEIAIPLISEKCQKSGIQHQMNALKDSIEEASQQTKGNWINSLGFFFSELKSINQFQMI